MSSVLKKYFYVISEGFCLVSDSASKTSASLPSKENCTFGRMK